MFYRLNEDGSVLDWGTFKYHEDCAFTDKQIINGWDDSMYIEGEEPSKPAELIQSEIQSSMTDAVQRALDAFAQTRGYDGIMSACSYSNSTDAQFKLEADYCIQLRDTTWRMGYAILAEVKVGTRPIPSVEELIDELPVGSAKWPDEE